MAPTELSPCEEHIVLENYSKFQLADKPMDALAQPTPGEETMSESQGRGASEGASNGLSMDKTGPKDTDDYQKKSNEGITNDVGDANGVRFESPQTYQEAKETQDHCPVTRQPHLHLLNFMIAKCPACSKEINSDAVANTQATTYSPPENLADVSPDLSSGSRTPEEKEDIHEEKIIHAVEYRDSGDYCISTVDWTGPFNLEKERREKREKLSKTKDWVLKVLTILKTSIPPDSSRASYEKKELLDDGIIDNPSISVEVSSRQLVIRSQPFIDALRSVISDPRMVPAGQLRLSEPYSLIAHHLEKLRLHKLYLDESVSNGGTNDEQHVAAANHHVSFDSVARKHLELVIDFMENELGDSMDDELCRQTKSPGTCIFRMLWFLFKPGDTVYVNAGGKIDACVVESVAMGDAILSSPPESLPDCTLNLWYLDFDGRHVTRCKRTETISSFQGEKPILSLSVVPAEFQDREDGGRLRSKLEDEGVKWYQLLAGKQVHYIGEFVSGRRSSFEGRVFVDTKSYYDLEGLPKLTTLASLEAEAEVGIVEGCKCTSCQDKRDRIRSNLKAHKSRLSWENYDSIDPTTVKSLDIEDTAQPPRHGYLVCSRNLKGFVFKTRKWETIDVAFCHDTKPNKAPFKHLVMPKEKKMLIKSLVYKYTDPRYALSGSQVWGADFIKNKGYGNQGG
ncbi:hypothetical protein F5Y07DRAFT_383142 [Xylaria sp. FL0933]|nr:hypothetical protein F5Y07DRAFT_383142 [Xylaria sp. FL0933]